MKSVRIKILPEISEGVMASTFEREQATIPQKKIIIMRAKTRLIGMLIDLVHPFSSIYLIQAQGEHAALYWISSLLVVRRWCW